MTEHLMFKKGDHIIARRKDPAMDESVLYDRGVIIDVVGSYLSNFTYKVLFEGESMEHHINYYSLEHYQVDMQKMRTMKIKKILK